MQERNKFKELPLKSFFINVIIGIILGLSIEILPKFYLEPYHRGFYCNDPTIQLRYKSSTIRTSTLFMAIFFLPFIGITIVEIYCSKYCKELYRWQGFYIHRIIVNCFKYYAYNLLGILLTLFLTISTKFIVGELRPVFLDICNPIYDNTYCLNQTYILNYKCRGNNYNVPVKEARLSFFSGHASLAMTTAVFFVIYIQSRIPRKSLIIIATPLMQLFILGLALFTGYTRIIDGMHHLHDVIIGYAVGVLIGYSTAKYVAKLKLRANKKHSNDTEMQKAEFSSISSDGDTPA